MAGNAGFGISAALNAFNATRQIGEGVRNGINQVRVRNAISDGMDSANQDRENAINGLITQTGDKNNPSYQVAGRTFSSQSDAHDFAAKHVADVSDFFNNNYAPKVTSLLMKQGNPDLANQWQNYVNDEQTQSSMRYFGKANAARMLGDQDGMVSNLMAAVNAHGGIGGYKITGASPITNQQGQVTGYNLMGQNSAGQTITQPVDGDHHSLFNIAATLLPGKEQFQNWLGQQAAAAKLGGEAAIKQMEVQGGIAKEGVANQGKENVASIKAEAAKNIANMRETGANSRTAMGIGAGTDRVRNNLQAQSDYIDSLPNLTDAQRASMKASLVAPRGLAQPTDPAKQISAAYDSAARNDLDWSSKTPEQQNAEAKQNYLGRQSVINDILGSTRQQGAGQQGAGQQAAAGQVTGLPMAQTDQGQPAQQSVVSSAAQPAVVIASPSESNPDAGTPVVEGSQTPEAPLLFDPDNPD